ncbi:hypothetical protein [Chryseobacterium koreense]|nr:hypothetical protein [Chryseobacterium koreense]MBB5333930.1 hypothetical protein [Chryseobacterium koreense]
MKQSSLHTHKKNGYVLATGIIQLPQIIFIQYQIWGCMLISSTFKKKLYF